MSESRPNQVDIPGPGAVVSGGEQGHGKLMPLALAALGVVFGDIGTSPIYAFRESFHQSYGLAVTPDNVLGVLSLIFWSLIVVISIKYLALVMRADINGEGGVMVLTALVLPGSEGAGKGRWVLVLAGLFGAALLYGDSMITPAISVLSAIEGLEVATPVFAPYVVPITIVVLLALFTFQKRGTAGVGAVFGPVTLLWFIVLGILGVVQLVQNPGVLAALVPTHAVSFFARNHMRGFLVLGSVFLVVTGGEALYADMGHFGIRPIRLAWFAVVLPALLLNYFGQGALLVADPSTIEHPFFLMAPGWALYPLVAIATAATVIASQAVISGAFSMTRQAVQFGYLPRLRVEHTSPTHVGQIYMPAVNWGLMIACVGLVLGFRSSSNLAAAYGVAVTTNMVFTTILLSVVARTRWGWHLLGVGFVLATLLVVDLGFWGANLPKIPHGGWFPLLVAAGVFAVMTTWKRGREILGERMEERLMSFDTFLGELEETPPARVPGTAVYLASQARGVPHALVENFEHNRALHERVVFLTIVTRDVPRVRVSRRAQVSELGAGMYRIVAHYGFTEDPDVPAVLAECEIDGEGFDLEETTFFLGRENVMATERPGMALWRERLFARMTRNALGATKYFQIPPDRVVEIGAQIEL